MLTLAWNAPQIPSTPLRSMISFGAPNPLVECMESLLRWNPSQRPSAKELLPMIQSFQNEGYQLNNNARQNSRPTVTTTLVSHESQRQLQQYDTSSPEPEPSSSSTDRNASPSLARARPHTQGQEYDAVSLAPSYHSRFPHNDSTLPLASHSQSHLLLPHYDDVNNLAATTSSTGSGPLDDYFARVLAGGALITATSDEFREYLGRTTRLRGRSCRVVQCIRRSESGVRVEGNGAAVAVAVREFLLVQCALGVDKGNVWLRLERLERTGDGGSTANDIVSNCFRKSFVFPPTGDSPSVCGHFVQVSMSSAEVELYDKDASRMEAHHILSQPVPLSDLARMLELVANESAYYGLWPVSVLRVTFLHKS